MGLRRQAREIALKMLFQIDLGKLDANDVINYFLPEQKAADEVLEHAKILTQGVVKERAKIDRLIAKQAHNWEIDRIAGVDRNLLRLATYEMLRFPDIPKNVIINEAIEMAKKYSTVESGSFINGVLDKIISN
jgi:transcription antitermination protein NusB